MEKSTCFLKLCIGLLDMTPKEQEEKNISTLDFSKAFIQNFCVSKNTVKKMKRQAQNGRKHLQMYVG